MDELDRYFARQQYSRATRTTYRRILEDFLTDPNITDLEKVSDIDLLVYIDKPTWEEYGSMRYIALSCIKEYLRFNYGEKHPALMARTKRRKGKVQRTLTFEQLDTLIGAFDTSREKGARDAAIVGVAVDASLRVAEIARLRLKDVHFEKMWLQVVAKGGDWRTGFLSPDTISLVNNYLNFRQPKDNVQKLFLSTQGKTKGQGLTKSGIQTVFKRLQKDVGFRISPHDLRRTFATHVILKHAPPRAGRLGGGWKSREQFENYTRAIEAEEIRPYLPMLEKLTFKK